MDGTKRTTMIDLVNIYMEWHEDDWKPKTKDAYRSLYKDFARKWDATHKAPKNIDRLWIASYFVGPNGISKGGTPGTHNIRRTQLRAFVLWCIDHGYFKPGVWPDKDVKRRRPAPRDLLRLNVAEMDRIMDRADPYDRWVLALLRLTLLRESEALRIIVGDVTIATADGESTIRVLRTKAEREDGAQHYDDMAMWGELVDEYHRWIAEYEKLIGGPVLNSYPLIPRWVGRAPSKARPFETRILKTDRPPAQLRTIVKKHLRSLYPDMPAEKLKGNGSHTMRRSGAVELLNALEELGEDNPLSVVQATLDHKDVRMTMHYIGEKEERRRRNKTFARHGRMRAKPGLHVVTNGDQTETG